MKKIILLDGNSIMFRAYYATAYTGNLMKTSDNLYTNAIYAFVNMINKLLTTEGLTNIFVAFDKGKKTFRHQAYSEYKGTRKPMPEEFAMQIPFIKEYLDILKIYHLETDDYEADDLIGTMAKRLAKEFDEVIVISGDHDLLQLVKGNVKVLLTKKGISDLEEYNENNFKTLMGINPEQLIDYKGLIGDSSDNLLGVSGIGPKTAIKLLEEYQTLENIIANIPALKGKIAENITKDQAQALMTKKLATIEQDASIDVKLEDTRLQKPNLSLLHQFLERLEFTSLIKRINFDQFKDPASTETIKKPTDQPFTYVYNDLEKTLDALNTHETLAIEVELDGDNYHKASLLGIALATKDQAFYLDRKYLTDEALKKAINASHTYYTIDAKKTYVSLKYLGINLAKIGFDVTLASYVINPSYVTSDIKTIIEHFIQTSLPYFEEVYGKKSTYTIPSEDVYAKYAQDKSHLIFALKTIMDDLLDEAQQKVLLYEIELPLAKILGQVEMNGFKVNEEKLTEVGNYFNDLMKKTEKEIFDLVGFSFNIASPKQLGTVLFENLKLGKGKKTKTGYSTSAEVLEELARYHEVPKLVLDYRKYAKLYSTYVVGLLSEVSPQDHKVHTIFKQALTQTGRLSSTEPNIQNIPVRTEEGRIIRSVFIPSTTDGYLVSADYSQIELRILASLASCQAMIETFNQNVDLHASTAAKIYNVSLDMVTKEMRRMAKAVNFGIVYGMSDWGLSEELHISPKEASIFSQKYFEVFPEVKPYLDRCIKEAKEKGYTTTIYQRRRYMPEINSTNATLRKFSERASMNAPIQGSAADIMKIAMIKVQKAFDDHHLKAKIVAQVHDELIVDVEKNELEIVKKLLKETMENAVSLKVKLDVDVEYGKTWDLK